MANEISFVYNSGETLTFNVYSPKGTEREVDSALAETPASSGMYLGTPATIKTGDIVLIKDSDSNIIGGGEYVSFAALLMVGDRY